MEFIDLQRQYRELEKEINDGIKNVLEHGKYIMGPEVQQLEKELCDYTGSKYCLTCANGTDALQKRPPDTAGKKEWEARKFREKHGCPISINLQKVIEKLMHSLGTGLQMGV